MDGVAPNHAPTRRLMYVLAMLAALAILAAGALLLRQVDINRIKAEQAEADTALIHEQQRSIRVLCNRGFILIDLTEAALILVGQRLEADLRRGDAQAVKADQQFLSKFITNREKLTTELTDPESPCAVPS